MSLPGVGSKIANLVLGDVFGQNAIVADTHCIRISKRLGLSDGKNQHTVEKQLDKIIPKEKQSDFCHRLVLHGRAVCSARKPTCDICVLHDVCAKKL
jgi:endonuclease-3